MGPVRILQSAARRAGLHVGRVPRATFGRERGQVLRAHGVTFVVDVGANDGGYGRDLRTVSGFRGRILSLEPGRDAFGRLEAHVALDPMWDALRVAASDSTGVLSLQVPRAQSSLASVLPPAAGLAGEASTFGVDVEEVDARRVDDVVVPRLGVEDRVHLKIDVQGFEDRVLSGATGLFDRVVALECEVALRPMYAGQRGFRAMVDAIDDLGFQPVNVHRNYVDPATGEAYDADILFVRSAHAR